MLEWSAIVYGQNLGIPIQNPISGFEKLTSRIGLCRYHQNTQNLISGGVPSTIFPRKVVFYAKHAVLGVICHFAAWLLTLPAHSGNLIDAKTSS